MLTLIVLALAMVLERHDGGFLTVSTATLAYSLTLFFHMIPAFTVTGTRLQLRHLRATHRNRVTAPARLM